MGDMDWIDFAEGNDRWRAVVNTVMNFGFHKIRGVYWLAGDLLHCQEALFSMEFS
jgi:hypothetical protein